MDFAPARVFFQNFFGGAECGHYLRARYFKFGDFVLCRGINLEKEVLIKNRRRLRVGAGSTKIRGKRGFG